MTARSNLAGVITNLMGGFIGSRVGLRKTLCAGLVLQLVCLAGLAGWQEDGWSLTTSVVFVALFQSLGGVAKDFVKLSGTCTLYFDGVDLFWKHTHSRP